MSDSRRVAKLAKIALRHDFPVWRVLGEDYPDEMWTELGRVLGLPVIASIDL